MWWFLCYPGTEDPASEPATGPMLMYTSRLLQMASLALAGDTFIADSCVMVVHRFLNSGFHEIQRASSWCAYHRRHQSKHRVAGMLDHEELSILEPAIVRTKGCTTCPASVHSLLCNASGPHKVCCCRLAMFPPREAARCSPGPGRSLLICHHCLEAPFHAGEAVGV